MKAFKVLHSKVIILVLAFILLGTSISSFALINENCSVEPKGLTINTEDRIIGEFYYDNFKVDYNIQGVVIYVRQPIDIKPIPPVEVVPPVEEGTGGVTSQPSNQKPVEDNKEQGTGGVNDNIQENLPVGKGR